MLQAINSVTYFEGQAASAEVGRASSFATSSRSSTRVNLPSNGAWGEVLTPTQAALLYQSSRRPNFASLLLAPKKRLPFGVCCAELTKLAARLGTKGLSTVPPAAHAAGRR